MIRLRDFRTATDPRDDWMREHTADPLEHQPGRNPLSCGVLTVPMICGDLQLHYELTRGYAYRTN